MYSQRDSVFGTKQWRVEDTERDVGDRGWPGYGDVLLLYLLLCFARHDMISVARFPVPLDTLRFFFLFWSLLYSQGERLRFQNVGRSERGR